jgi:hypothetical protein
MQLQAAKSLRSLAVGIAPDAANIMTNKRFHHNQCCCFLFFLRGREWRGLHHCQEETSNELLLE